VSSFELQHSGIVTSLLNFLTQRAKADDLSSCAEQPGAKNASKRKLSAVANPPSVVTRRRSKTDAASITAQSLNATSCSDAANSDRPKSAPSEEMMQSAPSERAVRHDAFLTEPGPAGSNPDLVDKLNRDDRLRCFLSVFAGLPVSTIKT